MVPEDLASALHATPTAASHMETLSHAHRRSHVIGILLHKFIHPMHLHGGTFTNPATDGNLLYPSAPAPRKTR